MNIKRFSIVAVSSLIISLLAMIPINNSYSKEEPWMKKVSDDTKLIDMSIPGTHDSGATHSIFDVSGRCQDLDIESQLNIGVRFFDIRLEMRNNKFHIVHSFVDQKLTFQETLNDFVNFIKKYPSEFLLVSIKKETENKNSTLSFEECLLNYFNEYQDYISYSNELPELLKDARGKIYILSRYSDSSIGIPAYDGWGDDTTFELDHLYVQDNYCLQDANEKCQNIYDTFKYSESNTEKLVLNFTSGYYDYGFPPTYAGTVALDINPWLEHYLSNNEGKLGIVVMDFVSEKLCEAVYKRNII